MSKDNCKLFCQLCDLGGYTQRRNLYEGYLWEADFPPFYTISMGVVKFFLKLGGGSIRICPYLEKNIWFVFENTTNFGDRLGGVVNNSSFITKSIVYDYMDCSWFNSCYVIDFFVCRMERF